MKQLHAAFNLTTGEVILTTRACALRHRIKHNEAWDRANGYYAKSEWVFVHGDKAYEKLCDKSAKLLAQRGGAR
jgi:hypothetical protein